MTRKSEAGSRSVTSRRQRTVSSETSRPNTEQSRAINELKSILRHHPLVILGVGSELRGDDAWTYHLVERIKKSKPKDVHCIWGSTMPENFVKPISSLSPSAVLICDSADFGATPGSYNVFSARDITDESAFTHRMPLRMMAHEIEERAKCPVFFLFVQPKNIEFSDELTPIVRNSLDKIAHIMLDALAAAQ